MVRTPCWKVWGKSCVMQKKQCLGSGAWVMLGWSRRGKKGEECSDWAVGGAPGWESEDTGAKSHSAVGIKAESSHWILIWWETRGRFKWARKVIWLSFLKKFSSYCVENRSAEDEQQQKNGSFHTAEGTLKSSGTVKSMLKCLLALEGGVNWAVVVWGGHV